MTIDERLQALTESVELLLASQRAHEDAQHVMNAELGAKMHAMNAELSAKMHAMNAELSAKMHVMNAELGGKMAQLMDTMNRLGRIIEIHDERLDSHEGRLDTLEGGSAAPRPPRRT